MAVALGVSTADLCSTCQAVVPRLYIGPITCARDADYLARIGVTHRVTCLEERLAEVHGVTTHHVRVRDDNIDDIGPLLPDAIDFIAAALKSADNAVLVHCSSGASRSAAVVLAYLVSQQRMPLADAMQLLSSARSCVSPGNVFHKALDELDERAFGRRSARPADYHALTVRAVTSRPLDECVATLAECGGSVEAAVQRLL